MRSAVMIFEISLCVMVNRRVSARQEGGFEPCQQEILRVPVPVAPVGATFSCHWDYRRFYG